MSNRIALLHKPSINCWAIKPSEQSYWVKRYLGRKLSCMLLWIASDYILNQWTPDICHVKSSNSNNLLQKMCACVKGTWCWQELDWTSPYPCLVPSYQSPNHTTNFSYINTNCKVYKKSAICIFPHTRWGLLLKMVLKFCGHSTNTHVQLCDVNWVQRVFFLGYLKIQWKHSYF